MRCPVKLNVKQIDEYSFKEYVSVLPSRAYIDIYETGLEGNNIYFFFNIDTVLTLIDIILGGKGSSNTKRDWLTDIEIEILREVHRLLDESLKHAWNNLVNGSLKHKSTEYYTQFAVKDSEDGILLVMEFEIIFLDYRKPFSLWVPLEIWKKIEKSLEGTTAKEKSRDRKETGEYEEKILRRLLKVPLNITAEYLGNTMKLKEAMSLQREDKIILRTNCKSDLILKIEGVPKYRGEILLLKGKRGIKIMEGIRGEE